MGTESWAVVVNERFYVVVVAVVFGQETMMMLVRSRFGCRALTR